MLSLDILRIVVPTAEISVLLLNFLFRSLARLNDSVSGYKPVKDNEKIEEIQWQPRRVLLLLPLLAVTITYLGDGGLLILQTVTGQERSDIGIFYTLASLAIYWTCSVMLLAGEKTDSLPIFLVALACECQLS